MGKGKPFATASVPIHSPKFVVWIHGIVYGGDIFLRRLVLWILLPMPRMINGMRILLCHIIPILQKRSCLDRTIFMQDGTPPHSAKAVTQLHKRHFRNNWVISGHCPTSCPSRSPDLNPCDFRLWDYHKNVAYSGPIANLAELKTRITQHISNVTPETLRFVVEHDIYLFQIVAENVGKHSEPVCRNSSDN